jgi:hypothetical protein
MKCLLIICCLIFSFVYCGCRGSNTNSVNTKTPTTESVYIDKENSWVNNCPNNTNCTSGINVMTIRVINNKHKDVYVTVGCFYQPSGMEFGSRSKLIKPRNSTNILIRGFSRSTPDSETVSCRITKVK